MNEPNSTSDLLLFDIGPERFALQLASVASVIDGVAIHRGAASADLGDGVVRIGQEFITVYEPHRVLGVKRSEAEPYILLLPSPSGVIALCVDHAESALAVPMHAVRDLAGMGTTDGVVIGALRPADRWVTLLEVESLVAALMDVRRERRAPLAS